MSKERKTSIRLQAVEGRPVRIGRYRGQYAIECPGLGIKLVRKAEDAFDHVRNVILPPLPDGRPNTWTPREPKATEELLLSIAELANDERS